MVAVVGVTWQVAVSEKNTQIVQKTTGVASPNINIQGSTNTSLRIHVEDPKKGLKIPKFDGPIQPQNIEEFKSDSEEYLNSSKFNEFMMNNEGKIVYLDIYPYYTDEDGDEVNGEIEGMPDTFVFTIKNTPYEFNNGGVEYLIDLSGGGDFYFDNRWQSRSIRGYFKIIGMQGPRQGFMSVSMKPINIETAELLKK